jgi:hypothetical protein
MMRFLRHVKMFPVGFFQLKPFERMDRKFIDYASSLRMVEFVAITWMRKPDAE